MDKERTMKPGETICLEEVGMKCISCNTKLEGVGDTDDGRNYWCSNCGSLYREGYSETFNMSAPKYKEEQ